MEIKDGKILATVQAEDCGEEELKGEFHGTVQVHGLDGVITLELECEDTPAAREFVEGFEMAADYPL